MKKIERKIHSLDASGRPLGRLASQVAMILMGKNRPDYQPQLDNGDIVEVVNCDKIKLTGKKLEQKEYIWHSHHPGGLKRKKVKLVLAADPGEVLRRAVVGMLPKNRLQRPRLKRLKIK
ncbi:MAG: 50S ribosomal protein L13 [Patescibacteria group bacterium]